MHHPRDRITHTTAFVTPVVEHWLEQEIAQWVHPMKDRSDDPSHHERTLYLWAASRTPTMLTYPWVGARGGSRRVWAWCRWAGSTARPRAAAWAAPAGWGCSPAPTAAAPPSTAPAARSPGRGSARSTVWKQTAQLVQLVQLVQLGDHLVGVPHVPLSENKPHSTISSLT